MKKASIIFITLLSALSLCIASTSNHELQLFNCIHFVKNSPEIISVELSKIEQLLESGTNPNWINPENKKDGSILSHYTSLISCTEDPNTIKKGTQAVKLLFNHGAKVQYCDKAILFFPISSNNYEIVDILLRNGVSATFWPKEAIGGSDYHGTPILEATKRGYEKVVDLLVAHGAHRIDTKKAIQIRFVYAARFETVEQLIELAKKGADVNTKDHGNETALINALSGFYRYHTYQKIIYLLDLGANVNQNGRSLWGGTLPLHEAIRMSSFAFKSEKDRFNSKEYAEQILKELLSRGALVSGRDENDRTPLHIAAKYSNLVAARMLIEGGTKLMDKDREGKTALDYAESAEMIKLLKESGAREQP